jgi:hypothetical protein
MSGPKGGSYRVESVAEHEARMLRDAKAQYARAETLWNEAISRLAAVERLTGQRLTVEQPQRVPERADADTYTRVATALEAAASATAARATHVREQAARSAYNNQVEQIIRDIKVDSPSEKASRRTGRESADEQTPAPLKPAIDRGRVNERVQRRLNELASIDHDYERVRALLADIAKAGSRSRIDMLIGELDYQVSEAKTTAAQREAAAVTLAELIAMQTRVAELAGPETGQLRSRIADLINHRAEAVPPDLAAAVEAAVSSADDEADRQCVVAAMRKALINLGYVVGPEFSTGLLGRPSVAYARNGSTRYGVKIRLEPDHARFSAQAVKSDCQLSSREEDAAAEREFCSAINEVVKLTKQDGVDIAFDTRARAGEFPIQQVADPKLGRPTATRSAPRSAPAQKQARR